MNPGALLRLMMISFLITSLFGYSTALICSADTQADEVTEFATGTTGHRLVLKDRSNTTYMRVPDGKWAEKASLVVESTIPQVVDRYKVGGRCLDIITADMDRDGQADVAAINEEGEVVIFLNDGGLLQEVSRTSFRYGLTDIDSLDINGDGAPDLVVANKKFSEVYVLLNKGVEMVEGELVPRLEKAATLASGNFSQAVIARDLDGDGNIDIATANKNEATVSVFKGLGPGDYTRVADIPVAGHPMDIDAGDINGDGKADLILVSASGNVLTVLENKGSLSFDIYRTWKVGGYPVNVLARDMDGDGNVDMIALNEATANITYVSNQGEGEFETRSYGVLAFPQGITTADIDNDGQPDILVSSRDTNSVFTLMNTGQGRFRNGTYFSVGDEPRSVAAADMDGDGDMDVISGDSRGRGFTVAYNHGDGIFSDYFQFHVGDSPRGMAMDDIDGDGDIDVLTANYYGSSISILYNDGEGHFPDRADVKAGIEPFAICTGDFNNDGKRDIAVADEARFNISVLLNHDGFTNYTIYKTGGYPFHIAAADLDGDGLTDVVTSNFRAGTVSVFISRGDGTFEPHVDYELLNMSMFIVLHDIDLDGDLDIVAAVMGLPQDPINYVSILYNNGKGVFEERVDAIAGTAPSALCMLDYNGDGFDDIMVTNGFGDSLTVIRNNEGTGFTTMKEFGVGSTPFGVSPYDWNGDGNMDLLVTNLNDSSVSILENKGGGEFPEVERFTTDYQPYFVYAEDFDGDGAKEIATVNKGVDSIAFFPDVSPPKKGELKVGATTYEIEFKDGKYVTPDLANAINDYIIQERNRTIPVTVSTPYDGIVVTRALSLSVSSDKPGVVGCDSQPDVYWEAAIVIFALALLSYLYRRVKRNDRRG